MNKFKRDASIEDKGDVLGGGYKVFNTGIYAAKIVNAYFGKSSGGADSVFIEFETKEGTYSETFYVTNKQGKIYSIDKQGAKVYVPGFILVDELCSLVTGGTTALADIEPEKKYVAIWDSASRKKEPKEVEVLTEILDKECYIAIIKTKEYKSVKSGDEYVPTDDEINRNTISKVFDSEGYTYHERLSQEEPVFFDKWQEKFSSDYIQDRTKNVKPAPKAPSASKKGKNIFGD